MKSDRLSSKKIPWSGVCFALFFLSAGVVCGQGVTSETSQQVIERLLEFPVHEETQLVRVPSDSQIYESAQPDFRDVRLLNRSRNEVSYLVRQQTTVETRTIRHTWSIFDASLTPSKADGLDIRFQLKKGDPQPDGITLVTPLSNFEQVVNVFAGAGDSEVQLVKQAVLFDYSRYMNVRRTEIPLPKMTSREFRLQVQSPTVEEESTFLELTRQLQGNLPSGSTERLQIERRPFRIDRIELWHEVEAPDKVYPVVRDYAAKILSQENDPATQQTRIIFETRREPLDHVEIVTGDKNFSRAVEIRTKDNHGSFSHVIGRGTVKRILFDSIRDEELEIAVSGMREFSEYLLVIENRDSPPLNVSGIRAGGFVDEFIFLAEPGDEYRLQYSGEGLAKPSYDTAAISAILEKGTVPVLATLGDPQELIAEIRVKPWTLKDLLSDPWVYSPVIIVLVVILGVVLFQAVKRIDAVPSDKEGN